MALIKIWTAVFGDEFDGRVAWDRGKTLAFYKFKEEPIESLFEAAICCALLKYPCTTSPADGCLLESGDDYVLGTAIYRMDNPRGDVNYAGADDVRNQQRRPAIVIDKGGGRGYIGIITGQYYDMLTRRSAQAKERHEQTRWEHRVDLLTIDNWTEERYIDQLSKALDEIGDEGWEVVSCTRRRDSYCVSDGRPIREADIEVISKRPR